MSYVDRAPVGETCPSINRIIDAIISAKEEARFIMRDSEEKYVVQTNWIIDKLNSAIFNMEKIRQDNASLREWGNKTYELLEESESARQEALKQCDILESKLEAKYFEVIESNLKEGGYYD